MKQDGRILEMKVQDLQFPFWQETEKDRNYEAYNRSNNNIYPRNLGYDI